MTETTNTVNWGKPGLKSIAAMHFRTKARLKGVPIYEKGDTKEVAHENRLKRTTKEKRGIKVEEVPEKMSYLF